MRPIRVLHIGLGPIGTAALRLVSERVGLAIVGGVDLDPMKVGCDLGEVAGLGRPLRLNVHRDAATALRGTKPDVVVHCTASSIEKVMPELRTVLRAKAAIVSTTEELSYPGRTHATQARTIHSWAKRANVAVLGTGVNPGFAMDALPIALTAACERVTGVRIDRLQDARIRRQPFQQKIGAGLTLSQFRRKVTDGSVRHVGLTESIAMIADALGWTLDRIADRVQPKLAVDAVSSEFIEVAPGHVSGIVQDGVGFRRGRPVIRLHMEAYLGAPETYDSVEIEGTPPISMRIPGGLHGDVATPALVVNSIPKVLAAPPGLHTMLDLPLPSFFPGRS
jgi:4-hydroxy-tetrahydrodipicolinate reductase